MDSLLSGAASLLLSTCVSLLLEELGATAEELVGLALLDDATGVALLELVLAALLEETAGAVPPVTVIVPLFVAVVLPPVVVTVNLYAPEVAFAGAVPEM